MPEGRGLFEVARERIRTRHLAFRTEQAYPHWMRRYVKFHGGGLRLMEAHRLRVKDLVIERGEIIVRDAKGGKDRVTVLPLTIVPPIRVPMELLAGRLRLF